MSEVEHIAKTLGFPVVVLPDVAARSTESAIRFLVERLVQGVRSARTENCREKRPPTINFAG